MADIDELSEVDSLSECSGSDSESGESDENNDDITTPTWSNNTLGMKQFNFTKVNKLLVDIPGDKPIDWFYLLVDSIFLEKICEYTNQYALELYCSPNTIETSRITRWKDLTVEELKTFLGLAIHTGSIPLNRLQDYWKTHRLYNLPAFRQYMSRDRFLGILRCLTYCETPSTFTNQPSTSQANPQRNNRLFKVQELVDYFNNKMRYVYYPGRELAIDEAMLLWRGRLQIRQYVKGKRHKYGIKFYSLNEPEGLAIQLKIYGGASDELAGPGHVNKVVLFLMRFMLNRGHSLFMDNYYNSFTLASKLLSNNTYCTGTLRSKRKHNPAEVENKSLKKGELVGQYAEGVLIGKWRDKRNVLYISTQFENTLVTSINNRGQETEKPLPIVQYNAHMKGVDRMDQFMSYYPMERKTLRWYKKVFFHILHLLLVNSQMLYNMHCHMTGCKKMTLYEFRLKVLEELLPPVGNQLVTPPRRRPLDHTLVKFEGVDNQGKSKRRLCRVCYKKGNKNKRTAYTCSACPDQPGLCPVKCFDDFHKTM